MTKNSLIFAVALVASISIAGVASAQNSAFEGFYVGGQVAYSLIDVEVSGAVVGSDDGDGLGGGGFIGFGGTNGQLYGGIEAELGFDGAEWSQNRAGGSDDVEAQLTFGLGARIGYVIDDRYLIYGRFGWVRTNADYSFVGIGSGDEDFDGGRFGGGVEGKFGNIGVRGEYTYTIYEDKTVLGVNVDPDQHLFRIGVAYYF